MKATGANRKSEVIEGDQLPAYSSDQRQREYHAYIENMHMLNSSKLKI